MAAYDGQYGSPGVPGNGGALGVLAGGFRLKDLFPSAPWDIPQQAPGQRPRYLKPGEKLPLKDLFPRQPGSFADPSNPGIPAGGVAFNELSSSPGDLAGNPFGPQFVIQQRGIRGMTPAQLEELKQWDPGSSQQLQNIYDNRKPGGPSLLPLAYSNGAPPMGNAGVDAKALADFQKILNQDIESRYQNPSIKEPRALDGFVRSGLY